MRTQFKHRMKNFYKNVNSMKVFFFQSHGYVKKFTEWSSQKKKTSSNDSHIINNSSWLSIFIDFCEAKKDPRKDKGSLKSMSELLFSLRTVLSCFPLWILPPKIQSTRRGRQYHYHTLIQYILLEFHFYSMIN